MPNEKESNEQDLPEDTAKQLNPFKLIQRGEDTLGPDDDVQFADFSPRMLPADVPEPSPKDESALAPAHSKGSREKIERPTSDTSAQEPADKGDGQNSPNEDSSQTSSSEKKSG